ncbi:hypothetical protein AWI43_00680 [Streptomyces sp. WAC04657]|nr:hypothetical protein AWI43_00680 [Streptomyces sp. WAC04657]
MAPVGGPAGQVGHRGVGLAVVAQFAQLLRQAPYVLREALGLGLGLALQLGAQFARQVLGLGRGFADDVAGLLLRRAAHLRGFSAHQRSAVSRLVLGGPCYFRRPALVLPVRVLEVTQGSS